MIFYVLQQRLTACVKLISRSTFHPLALKESPQGRIDEEIEAGKVWRVRYLATFWTARSYKNETFKSGDYIRVVKREGLILFIERIEPAE